MSKVECLIALHNHYIDLMPIYRQLKALGFGRVHSLAGLRSLGAGSGMPKSYWLDADFDHAEKQNELQSFIALLHDEKSKEIAQQIIKYRTGGNLEDCPVPSLFDEYTPVDLPRYKSPLNLIDCGAYTGVAINKFERAGYKINKLMAFEPDIDNFRKLVLNGIGFDEGIFLPLGTWSSDVQLAFSSSGDMASSLNDVGDKVVQCVRIDSVQKDFKPNLIKLDVEGAEKDTLIGAMDTIKQYRPNLCVSVYHTPTDLYALCLMIHSWGLGYKFFLRVHEYNTFGTVLYCLQDELTC